MKPQEKEIERNKNGVQLGYLNMRIFQVKQPMQMDSVEEAMGMKLWENQIEAQSHSNWNLEPIEE